MSRTHEIIGGTYLQMYFFQPHLFVIPKSKIEKDNSMLLSKLFTPPQVVSNFLDLTQNKEF